MLLEIVPTPATLSIRRYRAKKAANHPRAGFFGSGSPTSLKYKSPAARHGSAELRFVSSALPENIQRLAPSSFGSSHAQTRASYAANHAGEDLEFSHGNQFHGGRADERRAWL